MPHRYDAGELGQLGIWVVTQRNVYKAGKLRKERIDALEEIGFEWDARKATWRRRFEELKRFQEENGHCNVPQRHAGELRQLGIWVMTQRKVYKAGKMSKERIDALEEIGIVWKLDSNEVRWKKWKLDRNGRCVTEQT